VAKTSVSLQPKKVAAARHSSPASATRCEEVTVAIQDELPQSRITLKYRTTINGEEEDIKLPMRTMVLGDFSMG
jgi:hypothetical protein